MNFSSLRGFSFVLLSGCLVDRFSLFSKNESELVLPLVEFEIDSQVVTFVSVVSIYE